MEVDAANLINTISNSKANESFGRKRKLMFSGRSGVISKFLSFPTLPPKNVLFCIVSNAIRACLASLSLTDLHSGPARYRIFELNSTRHEQIRGI